MPVQTVDRPLAYFSVLMHFEHSLTQSKYYIFTVSVTYNMFLTERNATRDAPYIFGDI